MVWLAPVVWRALLTPMSVKGRTAEVNEQAALSMLIKDCFKFNGAPLSGE